MTDQHISKYLANYAETGDVVAETPRQTFDSVIVVPAFDEDEAFISRFLTTNFSRSVIMIVVVNAPQDASGGPLERTRDLLVAAQRLLASADARHGLCVIDCVSQGRRLAPESGVGLARKKGMDAALGLIAAGQVLTASIWCSDADATLPPDLFDTSPSPDEAALTFAFVHEGDRTLAAAQTVYDQRMIYYRAQLARCGSPYAFIALGSALTVSAHHYAMVRGVPKRAAGEDFYLLNKLAKTGLIRGLEQPRIRIAARTSERVPFGTGPGVAKLYQNKRPEDEPFFYAPACFEYLSAWLAYMARFVAAKEARPCPMRLMTEIAAASASADLDTGLMSEAFCDDQALSALRASRRAGASQRVRLRHCHTWFDALRTLRSVHKLRDLAFPNLSANQLRTHCPALATAPGNYLTGIGSLSGVLDSA